MPVYTEPLFNGLPIMLIERGVFHALDCNQACPSRIPDNVPEVANELEVSWINLMLMTPGAIGISAKRTENTLLAGTPSHYRKPLSLNQVPNSPRVSTMP